MDLRGGPFGKQLGQEGRASKNGSSALTKEAPKNPLAPTAM